jgi:hypothetical protein
MAEQNMNELIRARIAEAARKDEAARLGIDESAGDQDTPSGKGEVPQSAKTSPRAEVGAGFSPAVSPPPEFERKVGEPDARFLARWRVALAAYEDEWLRLGEQPPGPDLRPIEAEEMEEPRVKAKPPLSAIEQEWAEQKLKNATPMLQAAIAKAKEAQEAQDEADQAEHEPEPDEPEEFVPEPPIDEYRPNGNLGKGPHVFPSNQYGVADQPDALAFLNRNHAVIGSVGGKACIASVGRNPWGKPAIIFQSTDSITLRYRKYKVRYKSKDEDGNVVEKVKEVPKW